jgi:hypothetical protein
MEAGTMAKFRKKPVVIEAILWNGMNSLELAEFLNPGKAVNIVGEPVTTPHPATIHTLEGNMRANPGDWIIKGVKGEFYPCKNDIFLATYEAIDDAT